MSKKSNFHFIALIVLLGFFFSIDGLLCQNTIIVPPRNPHPLLADLEDVRMFAYISELIRWSVRPSRYGVTGVDVSFLFMMYNRMGDPQIYTWGNSCFFAPHGTGILEEENVTFGSYYGCAEVIIPVTYPPGATNYSLTYSFALSEPIYTELPNGTYRFDIYDPRYPIPYFPTFGVTLIINETGNFRIYDEIPPFLFSQFSETELIETYTTRITTLITTSGTSAQATTANKVTSITSAQATTETKDSLTSSTQLTIESDSSLDLSSLLQFFELGTVLFFVLTLVIVVRRQRMS